MPCSVQKVITVETYECLLISGYCIRLRDPDLGLAVESCLRALMLSFCCDNHQDEKVLQNIMKSCFQQGRRPQIIVSQFTDRVYDVSTKYDSFYLRQHDLVHTVSPNPSLVHFRNPITFRTCEQLRSKLNPFF